MRTPRPPGRWHCGHWRDADGPCCGCGKPAAERDEGPCPGQDDVTPPEQVGRQLAGAALMAHSVGYRMRRDWFAGRVAPQDRKRVVAALQAWHESERHFEQAPHNGTCFCCCEACDPD